MYVQHNYGKFLNTQVKYAPKFINDLIFPNAHVANTVKAYASGDITRPLILSGRNGTGKSTIARLIPNAIEGMDKVVINSVKAYDLTTDLKVEKLYTRNKMFDKLFTVNGQRYSYYVVEEMNACIEGRNAFRVALDEYMDTDLTIITTNEVYRIDKGIRSRCEVLEVPACEPHIFFPYAKNIMEKENIEISDSALMAALEAAYEEVADNREYYKTLDRLFREFYLAQVAREEMLAKLV